jgi:hypothetical protein
MAILDQAHSYREFKELWDLLEAIEFANASNFKGYGIFRLFLLIQFMEGLRDRELEESLRTNIASKWFSIRLNGQTPNYSLFSKIRSPYPYGRVFSRTNHRVRISRNGKELIRRTREKHSSQPQKNGCSKRTLSSAQTTGMAVLRIAIKPKKLYNLN